MAQRPKRLLVAVVAGIALEYPITCCNADTTWTSGGPPKKTF